jgi:flagellar basal body-associated protein FliL
MSSTATTESTTGKGNRGWIASIIFVVVLLALGAWFWSTQRTGLSISTSGSSVKGSLHLETFVLNLADAEQRSYLRVGIDLGLGRELGRGDNASPVGEVRDTILGVLAQCRVEELLTVKGKAKLKEDLLQALQERVPRLEVEEVYFTEFLIQR